MINDQNGGTKEMFRIRPENRMRKRGMKARYEKKRLKKQRM